MKRTTTSTASLWAIVLVGCLSAAVQAQITSLAGDGVLNAPYRGTIDSLRAATIDIGYGEVKSHVEPNAGTDLITSANVEIWAVGNWDRSVLRLYREVDASGSELDLAETSPSTPLTVPRGPNGFNRFSLKAIGTKTLAVQSFTITFRFQMFGSTWVTPTHTIKVAPVTGAFCDLPGESEAYHYGTPILDVSVANARLTVPIGRTAVTLGGAFSDRKIGMGPAIVLETSDVVLPGAAESAYIQNNGQFRLGGNSYGPYKSDYGTPWAGYLIGYHQAGDLYSPEGTHFDTPSTTVTGLYRFNYIRPFSLSESHAASQRYTHDASNRVTQISDYPATPNFYINLQRTLGVVTGISTSDGRNWTIQSDGANRITGIVPGGGAPGARYFKYVNSDDPALMYRVTQVRLGQYNGGDEFDPDLGDQIMYKFVYDAAGDLREEWRYVDDQLRKVIEHIVVDEGHRQRKEWFGTGANDCRLTDFFYDTGASPPLNHRLASVRRYSGPNGTGTPYTTTYTHAVSNPRGNMVISQVNLPDGTTLTHDYDSPVGGVPFGLRTKTTHTGPNDGSLVAYDADYEFLYDYSPTDHRLFYLPRIVKQRDGRGVISEVTYDYENGGDDFTGDGWYGEESNQLLKQYGPTIDVVPSNARTPETRYCYDPTSHVLVRREMDFASGSGPARACDSGSGTLFRVTTFEYDSLLRMKKTIVDPSGENLVTEYQYVDNISTQDRSVIDPDSYYTKTTFDPGGRVWKTLRYLTAGGMAGNSYQTENVYDTSGRLHQQKVDNEDQFGNPISGEDAVIVTEYTHDRLGRRTLQTVDPGGIGQESNFAYNWLGDVTDQFDTTGRGVHRTYDGRGLVDTETPLVYYGSDDGTPDANLTTTFQYDEMGRRSFTYPPTYPDGPHEGRIYDDFGRPEQTKRHPGSDFGYLITTTYEYDDANHVTRTYVEEDGTVLSDTTAQYDEGGFNYESRQRLVAGVNDDANDPRTQRKFDWAGNVIEEKSLGDATVADRVLTTVHDTAGRVERVQDSLGGETWYELRDGRGNVTQQKVKLTNTPQVDWAVTNTVYDALSRAVEIKDPEDGQDLQHYRQRFYDSRGSLRRETAVQEVGATDVAKQTSVWDYDNAGRLEFQAVLADADRTAVLGRDVDRVVDYEYWDADGRLHYRTTYNNDSATPLTTTTTYDAVGRVDLVTDPSGGYTDDDYLANGRLEQRVVYDGLGTQTFSFGYDGHDRTVWQSAEGVPWLNTFFDYDGLDRLTMLWDPNDVVSGTEYDLVGRPWHRIEDWGGSLERGTTFAYNRLSQLTEQTAQNRSANQSSLDDQVTWFRSDSLGRRTRMVYPDSAADPDDPNCSDCVKLTYDLAGRLTNQADQAGVATAYTYDDRGLLLTRTSGSAVDTYGHDALGRVTLAERGTSGNLDAVSYAALAYTDLGDLDYETQGIADGTPRTVDYGYDQAGNRTSLGYPDGEVVAYAPTVLNQVASVTVDASPLLSYDYYHVPGVTTGHRLHTRITTTNDTSATIAYEQEWAYDDHRRTSGLTQRLHVDANTEVLADYAFTHDNVGNPLGQVVLTGRPEFAGDDRAYSVDSLNRLTAVEYFESGQVASTTYDLQGNRESSVDAAGEVTVYDPVNAGNEYPSINEHAVSYNRAGNLCRDEDGRGYAYDEQHRLTQVFVDTDADCTYDVGETTLANYTYDALGRRVTFGDPVAGTTIRYYYDGRSAIEERNSADARLRYHVNGAQYVDERVATWTAATPGGSVGTFTYYLVGPNYSVTGTGNADGTTIERVAYSATGDLTGPPAGYFFDADGDSDVDLTDLADFVACLAGPAADTAEGCAAHDFWRDGDVDAADYPGFLACFAGQGVEPPVTCRRSGTFAHDADGDRRYTMEDYQSFIACTPGNPSYPTCLNSHDFDASGVSDGVIDAADWAGFQFCNSDPQGIPPEDCFRPAAQGVAPVSGSFALHGQPVDVLSDGYAVQYSRARYYDLKHSRWLQRDPTGYSDGFNLYEAFKSNATANTDPMGTDVWVTAQPSRTSFEGRPVLQVDYYLNRSGTDLGWMLYLLAERGAVLRERLGTEYLLPEFYGAAPAYWDKSVARTRRSLEAQVLVGEEIAELESGVQLGATAMVALPVAVVAAPYATAAFSTTTVGITETTLLGNVAATSFTGGISLGSGSAAGTLLLGGDARQVTESFGEGFVWGTALSAPFGFAMPVGQTSAVSGMRVVLLPEQAAGELLVPADTIPAGQRITTYYPPNRGFLGDPANVILQPGARIDRFGFAGGTFASPVGMPAPMRALPPGTITKPYNIYEVVKPFDVKSGPAAPWFNELGLGTQYELPSSIQQLLERGYLKRVGK